MITTIMDTEQGWSASLSIELGCANVALVIFDRDNPDDGKRVDIPAHDFISAAMSIAKFCEFRDTYQKNGWLVNKDNTSTPSAGAMN